MQGVFLRFLRFFLVNPRRFHFVIYKNLNGCTAAIPRHSVFVAFSGFTSLCVPVEFHRLAFLSVVFNDYIIPNIY